MLSCCSSPYGNKSNTPQGVNRKIFRNMEKCLRRAKDCPSPSFTAMMEQFLNKRRNITNTTEFTLGSITYKVTDSSITIETPNLRYTYQRSNSTKRTHFIQFDVNQNSTYEDIGERTFNPKKRCIEIIHFETPFFITPELNALHDINEVFLIEKPMHMGSLEEDQWMKILLRHVRENSQKHFIVSGRYPQALWGGNRPTNILFAGNQDLISLAIELKKNKQPCSLVLTEYSTYQHRYVTSPIFSSPFPVSDEERRILASYRAEIGVHSQLSESESESEENTWHNDTRHNYTWSNDSVRSSDDIRWSRIARTTGAAGASPIPTADTDTSSSDSDEEDSRNLRTAIAASLRESTPTTQASPPQAAQANTESTPTRQASLPQAAQADTESTPTTQASPPQAAQADTESEKTYFFWNTLIEEGCNVSYALVKEAVAMVEKDVNLICPITHSLLKHPVCIPRTGHIYERNTIENWLEDHNTCPISRDLLIDKRISQELYQIKSKILNALKAAINTLQREKAAIKIQTAYRRQIEAQELQESVNYWFFLTSSDEESEPAPETPEPEPESKPEDPKDLRAFRAKRAADAAEKRISATKK